MDETGSADVVGEIDLIRFSAYFATWLQQQGWGQDDQPIQIAMM